MPERTGKSWNIWFESIRGNVTEAQKLRYLETYLEWAGYGFEEFYTKYYQASRSDDPRDLALMNSQIVNFFKYLRGEGYASGTAKNHIGVIVGFLTENGLAVNFTKSQRNEISRKPSMFKDNFSQDEIRSLLAATTNPRNIAIIHALKDTGMAVSDLADLKISGLKKALDAGEKFVCIDYRRNKTEEVGSPCFGYESLDAIREWLRWRAEKGYNCDLDSPLFVMLQESKGGRVRSEILTGVKMRGEAISELMIKIIARAGLSSKKLSAHCFRIYNASVLESAGANKNIVYRIQARQIPDSGKVYSRGEVLSSYQKAYEALAVGPKPQIIEVQDSRVAELEASNIKLKEKVAALEKMYANIDPGEKRIAETRMVIVEELRKHGLVGRVIENPDGTRTVEKV